MIKYNKHVSLLFSKNFRILLSKWEQWTYCKSLQIASNLNIWVKLNVTFSRKPDHKLLPFLICCYAKYNGSSTLDALQYFFEQFTSDEKQNIVVIRSHINTFYSTIVKYLDFHVLPDRYVIHLIKKLPEIKPK